MGRREEIEAIKEELVELAPSLDLWDDVLPALGIDPIEQKGDEIIAHCPDLIGLHSHGDSSPSFAVNAEKLSYNCFVCSGGGLQGLVGAILSLTEEQSMEWLREHATYAPEAVETFPDTIEKLLAYDDEDEVLPEFPDSLVFQYKHFHPYLKERGISQQVAERMNVGYDPEHQAIVIPHWHQGKLVGLQRRHIVQINGKYVCARCDDKKIPKYKNTARFPKNTTLYNYDRIEGTQAIIVESPFTVLYLMSCGIENVLASFGAWLAEDRQKMLWRFYDGVFFWPDNDPAGMESVRSATVILEQMVPTFIVPTVPGKKSDAANLDPSEIPNYLAAAYSSVILPMEGFKNGLSKVHRE